MERVKNQELSTKLTAAEASRTELEEIQDRIQAENKRLKDCLASLQEGNESGVEEHLRSLIDENTSLKLQLEMREPSQAPKPVIEKTQEPTLVPVPFPVTDPSDRPVRKQKKRKTRASSNDKYDNKEYQDKVEQNIFKMFEEMHKADQKKETEEQSITPEAPLPDVQKEKTNTEKFEELIKKVQEEEKQQEQVSGEPQTKRKVKKRRK